MSTHMPGFRSFLRFLCHFVLAKLATSSIRVDYCDKDFIFACFVFQLACQNFSQMFTHKTFRLLIPLLVFNGFEQAFMYADYNKVKTFFITPYECL